MDFLSTEIWWVFFILGALSYFISSFGHHGRGTRSPQIESIGGLGLIIFVVLTFIFSGWRSGIGIIVALFLWAVVAERILWLIFRKLTPGASNLDYNQFIKRSRYHSSSIKLPTSIEELFEQSDKRDEILSKISNQPKIIEVLQSYGKASGEIKDIFWKLMVSGAGEYVAQSVIENPKLLSEYLQMETDGISDVEIAFKFAESLGGP